MTELVDAFSTLILASNNGLVMWHHDFEADASAGSIYEDFEEYLFEPYGPVQYYDGESIIVVARLNKNALAKPILTYQESINNVLRELSILYHAGRERHQELKIDSEWLADVIKQTELQRPNPNQSLKILDGDVAISENVESVIHKCLRWFTRQISNEPTTDAGRARALRDFALQIDRRLLKLGVKREIINKIIREIQITMKQNSFMEINRANVGIAVGQAILGVLRSVDPARIILSRVRDRPMMVFVELTAMSLAETRVLVTKLAEFFRRVLDRSVRILIASSITNRSAGWADSLRSIGLHVLDDPPRIGEMIEPIARENQYDVILYASDTPEFGPPNDPSLSDGSLFSVRDLQMTFVDLSTDKHQKLGSSSAFGCNPDVTQEGILRSRLPSFQTESPALAVS